MQLGPLTGLLLNEAEQVGLAAVGVDERLAEGAAVAVEHLLSLVSHQVQLNVAVDGLAAVLGPKVI